MLLYFMPILEYFVDIWYILWPFGKFYLHLAHFFRFWYHAPRNIWQPLFRFHWISYSARLRNFGSTSCLTKPKWRNKFFFLSLHSLRIFRTWIKFWRERFTTDVNCL
jgi:hypothetical protein